MHARLTPVVETLKRGEPLSIAGFGDSLTAGWMVSAGFFERFVDRIEKRFEKATIERINAGIPGDTANGGMRRLGVLLTKEADLVTVQFGLNDYYCGVTAAAFRYSIDTIADGFLRAGVLPILVTSCPLRIPREQAAIDAFYDSIRSVAKARDLPLADLDKYWRGFSGSADTWSDLVQDDGVHPTDQGHAIMADGLFGLFEENS
jgi:acyl-CoA thioesterase I